MRKFIITAELRDLEKQVSLGEISYSRMIEILNERADKWHEDKVNELNKTDKVIDSSETRSCLICGFFCGNEHHSDSWYNNWKL